MPHITVEYSAELAGAFDRPGFAKGVHEAAVSIAGGRAGGCKTRFVRLDETFIADGSPHYAMVHVECALLSGRDEQTRRALGEAVLALLRQHLAPTPQYEVQLSVDQRDLDRATYVRHDEPRTAA